MYTERKEDAQTELPLYSDSGNPDPRRTASLSYKATMYEFFNNQTSTNTLSYLETQYPENIGYYYMIISVFCMSLNAMMAKLLEDFPTFQILFVRSLFALIMFFLYIYKIDQSINLNEKQNRVLILFQCSLFFVAASCYIEGIDVLNLSEAITILYTTPIFIGVLEWLMRGNALNMNEIACAAGGILGILMIITSSGDTSTGARWWGGILCLVHSIINAFSSITLKLIPNTVHPLAMVTYSVLISLILSAFGGVFLESWYFPTFSQLVGMMLMAVFFVLGQFFVTRSIQNVSKSGNVMILNYLQVLIACTFDVIIFEHFPGFWSFIGMALTVGVCIIINIKFR